MIRKMIRSIFSVMLTLVMVTGLLPQGTFLVHAAEKTYTLDATADLTAFAAGEKADGDSETAGTEAYFTIYYSAKTKVDGSNKTFDDSYTATQRLNFGGSSAIGGTVKNAVKFTTSHAATVKIWWVSGGDGREMAICDGSGTVITSTVPAESVKNALYISELSLDAAGTYYLAVPSGSNYVFKLEVTESVADTSVPESSGYVLDATADLAAMAAGEKADGDMESAGTEDYFTVIYSSKTKIDGSNKEFEDGYTATQRLNFGGSSAIGGTVKNAVKFTTSNAATVKIWWVSGGDGREISLCDGTGTVVTKTEEGSVKNSLYISELSLDAAGTYYLAVLEGSNYLFKLEVVEEAVQPSVTSEYVLDATADLAAMAAGEKVDGDMESAGTEDYFTVIYSSKTKIDGSNKEFDDGYTASQRLNFGGSSAIGETVKNAVKFTTSHAATVKIWWVSGGDGREMSLCDGTGTVVTKTEEGSVKNSLYISELSLDAAGTYYLAVLEGSNYLFKLQVTESGSGSVVVPERADWATVAAPVITEAVDNNSGEMKVTVSAVVGYDGADEVVVTMYDAEGAELASKRSIAEKDEHTLTFEPESSGEYTFKAVIAREGEESKASTAGVTEAFLLPLETPVIASGTSAGNGSVALVWGAVKEAAGYDVYCDGTKVGTTAGTEYTVSGLTVGQLYSFQVAAVRDQETSDLSGAVEVTVTAEAQTVWGFTRYGSSSNDANNGYVGSVNEDGQVTVYSENGKGKVIPEQPDQIAFYYTAIPTEYNFTLRATVTVDSWTYSNGQEGFGLVATDRLIQSSESNIWNNSIMAVASKIEYRYDAEADKLYSASESGGVKYSMKLGLGTNAKTGITTDALANAGAGVPAGFAAQTTTLDNTPGKQGLAAGTYNIIGNATNNVSGTIAELTTFVLEIQKNNTGYFITYYDAEGSVLAQQKYYDPDALNLLDPDHVYVGFFASRNARVTFTDIQLSTILASEDAPAEEKPITKIEPTAVINSSTVTTSEDYTVSVSTNVAGTAKITVDEVVVEEAAAITGGVRYDKAVKLSGTGEHKVVVVFTPDPDQDLGEDTVLTSADPITTSLTVTYNTKYAELVNLYISPNGKADAEGTRQDPMDVYTAINNVKAGQTIVVMEGVYKLSQTIQIQRGIDGTANEPIRMVADPEAASRPVFDFQGKCAGIVHGGDYWYFQGFDVTASQNGQKGFQVSGDYNTLDQINTYNNGNTGIQISRYSGTDTTIDQWPSYNLILNCTSYNNADAGYEDADGFAAKLTSGVGNVFDGCVAYNNADDGWDLYAKVTTGPIGSVVIRNCVAYANGYLSDGTNAGNGNGFKLGGESISGKHQLINSYAFYNKAKGIDSNSCPDVIVEDCTSYNNETYNVAFYTNNAANTDFSATGIISFKDNTTKNGYGEEDNLKPKGTQDPAKYLGDTNYYWNGSASKNASAAEITADMFVSLEFKGVLRNADSTINLQGFLELTETAPDGIGAGPGGNASGDVELKPDPEKDPEEESSREESSKEESSKEESSKEEFSKEESSKEESSKEESSKEESSKEESSKEESSKADSKPSKDPQTGDSNSMALWAMLCMFSFAGVAICVMLHKKMKAEI